MFHIHILCDKWIHVASKEVIVCSCVGNSMSVLGENHVLLMILYDSPKQIFIEMCSFSVNLLAERSYDQD